MTISISNRYKEEDKLWSLIESISREITDHIQLSYELDMDFVNERSNKIKELRERLKAL